MYFPLSLIKYKLVYIACVRSTLLLLSLCLLNCFCHVNLSLQSYQIICCSFLSKMSYSQCDSVIDLECSKITRFCIHHKINRDSSLLIIFSFSLLLTFTFSGHLFLIFLDEASGVLLHQFNVFWLLTFQVAARVTPRNADKDEWFVVKVIHFDKELKE